MDFRCVGWSAVCTASSNLPLRCYRETKNKRNAPCGRRASQGACFVLSVLRFDTFLIKGRTLTTPQFNYALKIGLSVALVRLKRPVQELTPMLYVSKIGKLCVVCHRIDDMPEPKVPSVRRECAQCHAQIWVAKGAPKAPKVCLECVTGASPSAIRRRLKQHPVHERRQHVH